MVNENQEFKSVPKLVLILDRLSVIFVTKWLLSARNMSWLLLLIRSVFELRCVCVSTSSFPPLSLCRRHYPLVFHSYATHPARHTPSCIIHGVPVANSTHWKQWKWAATTKVHKMASCASPPQWSCSWWWHCKAAALPLPSNAPPPSSTTLHQNPHSHHYQPCKRVENSTNK